MSRLQKKCFLASVGMHTTLVLVLFFGAAFLAPKELKNPMRTITMIPREVIDSVNSGGGGPPPPPAVVPPAPEPPRVVEAAPPPPPVVEPPRPTPPTPVPPVRAPDPVVVRPPVAEAKRPPKAIDHTATKKAKETKAKTPPIETTPPPKTVAKASETKTAPKIDLSKSKVVARNGKEVEARAEEARRAEQAAIAAAAKKRADQINGITGALSNLKENLSSGISVEPVGGDGPGVASYGQLVVSIYENAWIVPQDIADDNLVVQVTVTIARDGSVTRATILRPSGNATVNKSVRRTLDAVKFIKEFPPSMRDPERTFNIDFNLKAKRLRG
jgi:TonB family protein